jgi:rhomboid-like protein
MTAFVFVVCLLCYGFAHYHVPPSPKYRLWPELSPSTATLAAMVGANVIICALWRVAPLWPLMTRYFMHVPGYPRAIQAVGNVFSHIQYEHILGNMMMLLLAGSACHELVGRGTFLGTYIAAGAVGTLVSLYWANIGRGSISAHSVGASAAIWGIAALYCLLSEQNTVAIPFVKDKEVSFYPKILFGAFAVGEMMSAWASFKRKRGTADHASHFGGMAVGVVTAGYMHASGWRPSSITAAKFPLDGSAAKGEVVDPGAMIKEEFVEIEKAVKNALEKKE